MGWSVTLAGEWPELAIFSSWFLSQSTGWAICILTILRGCFEVTEWFKIYFFNSSEKFTQLPSKVNKKYFLWHQAWPHNDLLLLKTKVQQAHQYLFMASNTLDNLAQKGNGKRNGLSYGHQIFRNFCHKDA